MRTRVCGMDFSHTLVPTHRDLRLDMDLQSDTCQQSLFKSGELTVIPSLPFYSMQPQTMTCAAATTHLKTVAWRACLQLPCHLSSLLATRTSHEAQTKDAK